MEVRTDLAPAEEVPPANVLFRGLVQCLHCSTRWVAEIRRADFFVLRRSGTLNFLCQHCGGWTAHRLVRIRA